MMEDSREMIPFSYCLTATLRGVIEAVRLCYIDDCRNVQECRCPPAFGEHSSEPGIL